MQFGKLTSRIVAGIVLVLGGAYLFLNWIRNTDKLPDSKEEIIIEHKIDTINNDIKGLKDKIKNEQRNKSDKDVEKFWQEYFNEK